MEEVFMPAYLIRSVRFEELDSCVDVIRRSFASVAHDFGLTVKNCPTNAAFIRLEHLISDWYKRNGQYVLVFQGQIIGFIGIERKKPNIYELKKLAVLPQHRHLGYGTHLIDYARQAVSGTNGNKITIGIIEENIVLKNWYLKQGFIHTETKEFPHLPFLVGIMEMTV